MPASGRLEPSVEGSTEHQEASEIVEQAGASAPDFCTAGWYRSTGNTPRRAPSGRVRRVHRNRGSAQVASATTERRVTKVRS